MPTIAYTPMSYMAAPQAFSIPWQLQVFKVDGNIDKLDDAASRFISPVG
jgi:hypothetical protein